jgi:hypothetical protein
VRLPAWQEHPLYSDAYIHGHLELGPYRFFVTAPAFEHVVGRAAMQLVVRADDHLVEPSHDIDWEEEPESMYFGGDLADELAALLSLALGRRLRSGGITRHAFDGSAVGKPTETRHRPPVLIPPRGGPMLPRIVDGALLDSARPFMELYPLLSATHAVGLVRAASQYADAVWIADADPRLAWIRLVGALESAAQCWKAATYETPAAQLKRHRRKVYNAIKDCPADVIEKVAADLAPTFLASKKFKDFVAEFDPGQPEGDDRPGIGRFSWDGLDAALDLIYSYRSDDLHAGVAFPWPLCEPPERDEDLPFEVPGGLAAAGRGGQWRAEDLPMHLHLFANVTRRVLLSWWESLAGASRSENAIEGVDKVHHPFPPCREQEPEIPPE